MAAVIRAAVAMMKPPHADIIDYTYRGIETAAGSRPVAQFSPASAAAGRCGSVYERPQPQPRP